MHRTADTSHRAGTPEHRRGLTAVVLPGTGSDAHFADRAFRAPLADRGITVVPVEPDPVHLVAGYTAAMDRAAADGPILVGGVSIGAAVALAWAAAHPDRAVGVLAALPAWTGAAGTAPAAASARWTATQLREHGLDEVMASMVASSPAWLAGELTRSWRSQWPDLPHALEEAAAFRAPDVAELRTIGTPVGIVSAVDDAVHPLQVGSQWEAELPNAALSTITLADVGTDPSILGASCLDALDRVNGLRMAGAHDRPHA